MTDLPEAPLRFNSLEEMRAWIAANHPDMYDSRNSKFAPKLTFTERCEAFALAKSGDLDRRQIAAAYGINRATLAYMLNQHGPHYKDVRREYAEYGHDRFLKKYITPNVIERYAASKKKLEVALSDDELKAARSEGAMSTAPNKTATKHAGPFHFSMPNENQQILGVVVWSDSPGRGPYAFGPKESVDRPPGWYVQVDEWSQLVGSEEHRLTSTSAKSGFIATNMLTEIES